MSFKLLPDKKISVVTQAEVMSKEMASSILDRYLGHPNVGRISSNRFSFNCIALDPLEWIRIYEPVTAAVLDANINNYGFKLQGISSLYYVEFYKDCFMEWSMDLLESSRETNKLSLYIPLNDGFKGGDLSIMNPTPMVIPSRVGELTMFPSFVPAKQDPTKSGTKAMIVGTVTGLPFS